VLRYAGIKSITKSQRQNIQSIRTWLQNNYDPIEAREVDFLNEQDLVSFHTQRKSSLRLWFEQQVFLPIHSRLCRPRSANSPTAITNRYVGFASDRALNALATIGVIVGIVLLLVSPLWILENVTNSKHKLGVIVGFLLTLLLFLNYAIVVTPFEVFAATAGYV